jgi:hypothetical protein
MGGCTSKNNNLKALVLQTGKLRVNAGEVNIEKQLPKGVAHRWLPPYLESKYEAIDFVNKFGLFNCDHFNIYNDFTNYVTISPPSVQVNESKPVLLENINIVVSCGSTSIQAFKLTKTGPVPILPVTDETLQDYSILGLKVKSTLGYGSTTNFGGGSYNSGVAEDILSYIKSNANRIDENGTVIPTNVIFVNQIGYSVLGFNPKGEPPLIPNINNKVVSMRFYDKFKSNNGKTKIIELFQSIAHANKYNNMFVVARQCKGANNQEISGQWANQAYKMISTEKCFRLANRSFNFILDLGGGSGTFYKWDGRKYTKLDRVKEFMKGDDKSPNYFENDLPGFIDQFNFEFSDLLPLE